MDAINKLAYLEKYSLLLLLSLREGLSESRHSNILFSRALFVFFSERGGE